MRLMFRQARCEKEQKPTLRAGTFLGRDTLWQRVVNTKPTKITPNPSKSRDQGYAVPNNAHSATTHSPAYLPSRSRT
ncbi:hypothetical protein Abor_013_137 [Acetobacter orientalis]|uniref:Uncharacterized protein n=1 Tax=Acetobacter orientalis TaxID=146474 RepID=A0A0D6NIE9_9PROT|nr:hypothetical protein Abor_013_137 [Acetobacter orientalis]